MGNLSVEDIAQEVYAICRERTNTSKECLELITRNIIGKQDLVNDEQLERLVRKYRETYKGLQELSEYVKQKCYE